MMKKNKEKKICFICSSGGHFSEINKLKVLAEKYNSFLVVEKINNFNTSFTKKIYFLKELNRKDRFFFLKLMIQSIKELLIFIKEKPSCIITTGALSAYPMCVIGKLFRKKIIYIESYARVFELSVTGKKLYNKADLFIVQWPNLKQKYPKAKYLGSLL